MAELDLLDRVVEKWLGSNYIIYSTRDPILISAGISEIEFPQANIEYIAQTGLSTKTQQIPVGVSYTDLVLRAPVERANTILSFKLNKMINYLKGRRGLIELGASALLGVDNKKIDPLQTQYENFVITAFNGGAAVGKAPIAVWFAGDCLLGGYTTDSANINDARIISETARFKIGSFKRQI